MPFLFVQHIILWAKILWRGVYQTDLTFIEDGNPDYLGDLINFGKCQFVYEVLEKLLKFQKDGYNLKLVPQIAKMLNSLETKSEDELYKLSMAAEPRGASKKEIK